MSYEVIDLDDEDIIITSTQQHRSIEIFEIDDTNTVEFANVPSTGKKRRRSVEFLDLVPSTPSRKVTGRFGLNTEITLSDDLNITKPVGLASLSPKLKNKELVDKIMNFQDSDSESDDDYQIRSKKLPNLNSTSHSSKASKIDNISTKRVIHQIEKTNSRSEISVRFNTKVRSNAATLQENQDLFLPQSHSTSEPVTLLDSSPIQQSTQDKQQSQLIHISPIQPSYEKSQIRKLDNETEQQDDKDEDEEVLISHHNVLLSSPEQEPDEEYPPVRRGNKSVKDISFDAFDASASTASSSIGQIKVADKTTKRTIHPLLPSDDLKLANHKHTPYSSSPLKGSDNNSKKAKSSNAFLDKLQSSEAINRKRLNLLRKELDSNKEQLKKSSEALEKDKTAVSEIARPKKNHVGSLEKSYSDPINNSFVNESIVIDDSDDDQHIVPTENITGPIVSRPAVRTQTLDSTRSRTTKEEREQMKAQKEKEKLNKRLYQEINKSKRTKDELLAEMIISIPSKVKELFIAADLNLADELKPIQIKSAITGFGEIKSNLVIWERKTNSKYDPEQDIFKPVDIHVIKERQSCLIFNADEFIKIIENCEVNRKFNEDEVVKKFKTVLSLTKDGKEGHSNMIILIVGLDPFISKIRNIENREYTKKVRENLQASQGNPVSTQPTKRNSSKVTAPLSKLGISQIEGMIAMLRIHGIKIYPTKNSHETMLWLKSFTYTISGSRYDKYERNSDLANIGTIKSGVNKIDTYRKMLLQFKRMTTLRTGKVMDNFKTMRELADHYINGNDLSHLITGDLELQMRRFFSTLNEDDVLRG